MTTAKVPRVVFRFGKLKDAGKINAAMSHNARLRPTPNADPTRDNIVIRACGADAHAAVRDTIGKQTVRKNAVLAVECIISASPEYFRPNDPGAAGHWEPSRLKAWREAMEPWIDEHFPHAVSVILHLDESTPHYQIIDVPLDDNGKLNARGKFGGNSRTDLARWQDLAAQPVKHLGIERGIPGSLAKHNKLKRYYAVVNAPTPAMKPKPLPDPPLPGLTQRNAAGLLVFAKGERRRAYRNVQPDFDAVATKAKAVDLATEQKRQAEATASRLASTNEALKAQADKLRELALDDVLVRVYGAKLANDSKSGHASRKYAPPDGREIAVTAGRQGADVWIEQGDKGQRGAINLVMHLDSLPYKEAVRLLADYYDGASLVAERTAQLERQTRKEVKEILTQPAPLPAPSGMRWPQVRQYLTGARALPVKLVDWLRKDGRLYADKLANAVFPRANGGAFVRGTLGKFFRAFGSKNAGAYVIPGNGDVWLTESPIDAVSIKSHDPQGHIMALGGSMLTPADIAPDVPEGRLIRLAFDNDTQGKRIAEAAKRIWPDALDSPPPNAKDWNEALQKDPGLVHGDWADDSDGTSTGPVITPLKPPKP